MVEEIDNPKSETHEVSGVIALSGELEIVGDMSISRYMSTITCITQIITLSHRYYTNATSLLSIGLFPQMSFTKVP